MDVVGERRGQSSQIAPDSTLDNFVGQQVASGLATASIVVLGNVLSSALECAPSFTPFSITLPAMSAYQWLRPYPASLLNTTDRTSGCESLKLSPVVWDKHADKFHFLHGCITTL